MKYGIVFKTFHVILSIKKETILAANVHSGKWEVHEYASLGIMNFLNIYSSKHWEILDYVVVKRSS